MNHMCIHDDLAHQCHCGIGEDHTSGDFLAWHEERGITVLNSQIG